MNVTKDGFKDRQIHIEDYLQMVSAEQKEYAEVFDYHKIAEKSSIITDYWTDNLLDQLLLVFSQKAQKFIHAHSIDTACSFI